MTELTLLLQPVWGNDCFAEPLGLELICFPFLWCAAVTLRHGGDAPWERRAPVAVGLFSSNLCVGICNHEATDHQTQIAVSDRIKDSIFDRYACAVDVTGRVWWPRVGSFRQIIRLVRDAWLIKKKRKWLPSYRATTVISSFCHYAPLYRALMKTLLDSRHTLVKTVEARTLVSSLSEALLNKQFKQRGFIWRPSDVEQDLFIWHNFVQ